MYPTIQKIICWSFICLFFITSTPFRVSAQVPAYVQVLNEKLTRAEFSALPGFLQDRILGGHGKYRQRAAQYRIWAKKIGSDYIHYHHWVLALVMFRRGILQTDEYKRKYLLERSIGEYSYVIEKVGKNNPQKYMLHYLRGEAYITAEKFEQAIKDFIISIKLKKDHRPSYLKLKNIYIRIGMDKQAAEMQSIINSRFPNKN